MPVEAIRVVLSAALIAVTPFARRREASSTRYVRVRDANRDSDRYHPQLVKRVVNKQSCLWTPSAFVCWRRGSRVVVAKPEAAS